MAELTDADKQRIVEVLRERAAERPCPRCGNSGFVLVGGYFNQTVQTELTGFILGGPSIPTAAVVCGNCGWLAQHALGILGLLPKREGDKPEGSKPESEK